MRFSVFFFPLLSLACSLASFARISVTLMYVLVVLCVCLPSPGKYLVRDIKRERACWTTREQHTKQQKKSREIYV